MPMNDMLSVFRQKLMDAGIVADTIEADGQLHRCGTTGKEMGRDGAYIVHPEEPASLWWKNWRTGDEGTFCIQSERNLTAEERSAYAARIARNREQAKKMQAERYAEARNRAVQQWESYAPATDAHPYLETKNVPAYGLRLDQDNNLVLPVLDADGKIQSLQFIQPNGEKRFLTGGKIAGGYYPLLGQNGTASTLLLAEGFATAATLHKATGLTTLVCFNCGNLEAVGKLARSKYPDREIIIAADNDTGTTNVDGTPINPGVDTATRVAGNIGAKVAICPAHEGKKTDFNDLANWRTLEAVRVCIEKSRWEGVDCPMPASFTLIKDGKRAGLYKTIVKPDGTEVELRIGDPLHVCGLTREKDGNGWGVLLEWKDSDKCLHTLTLQSAQLFRTQGAEWVGDLANGGYRCNPSLKKHLSEFLSLVTPHRRIRCVSNIGWYETAYVMPDAVYGETIDTVRLQGVKQTGAYRVNGSLEQWKEIPQLAMGNSRLEFALCVAFAGPLLKLANLEGGGFSLEGESSSGKTTALQVAASVWGGPEHVRTWRSTDNALESIALLHNDNLLVLDEVGQVHGRVLSECAYMLANGFGKGRMAKDGKLRKSLLWRLLFLSSGEIGLADKLNEVGIQSRAGQSVRFVGLSVEKNMLKDLHGHSDAAVLCKRIKDVTAQHYGVAGRYFLERLCDPAKLHEVTADLNANLHPLADALCACNADGQVKRVAQRFALCWLAGSLATEMGLLPQGFDSLSCTQDCFTEWLESRGGAGANEDTAILAAVQKFLEQHGASRFQDLDREDAPVCFNRVGFRHTFNEKTDFYFLPATFASEVVPGFAERKVISVLDNAGWLITSELKRKTCRVSLPGLGRVRVYIVRLPQAWGDGDE